MHHLDDSQQAKNFTFKCHREGNEIYSVNSLNFHPVRFMVPSWPYFSALILFKLHCYLCIFCNTYYV